MTQHGTPDTKTTEDPRLPVRDPGRARKIAALHALANFYAEHPEVDVPHYAMLGGYVTDEQLLTLADAHGVRIRAGRRPWIELIPVPGEEWINILFAVRDAADLARPL